MKFASVVQVLASVVCADGYKHRFRGHLDTYDPKWGMTSCQCIGAPADTSGTRPTIDNTTNTDFPVYKKDGKVKAHYVRGVGLHCSDWDLYDKKAKRGTFSCETVTDDNDWCAKRWCYVDPCTCQEVAKKSSYFPGLKDSNERLVFYSYTTCRSTDEYTCKPDDDSKNACPCWGSKTEGEGGACTKHEKLGDVPKNCSTVTTKFTVFDPVSKTDITKEASNCLHKDLVDCKASAKFL